MKQVSLLLYLSQDEADFITSNTLSIEKTNAPLLDKLLIRGILRLEEFNVGSLTKNLVVPKLTTLGLMVRDALLNTNQESV